MDTSSRLSDRLQRAPVLVLGKKHEYSRWAQSAEQHRDFAAAREWRQGISSLDGQIETFGERMRSDPEGTRRLFVSLAEFGNEHGLAEVEIALAGFLAVAELVARGNMIAEYSDLFDLVESTHVSQAGINGVDVASTGPSAGQHEAVGLGQDDDSAADDAIDAEAHVHQPPPAEQPVGVRVHRSSLYDDFRERYSDVYWQEARDNARPSYDTMAEGFRFGKKSVERYVRRLKADGLPYPPPTPLRDDI